MIYYVELRIRFIVRVMVVDRFDSYLDTSWKQEWMEHTADSRGDQQSPNSQWIDWWAYASVAILLQQRRRQCCRQCLPHKSGNKQYCGGCRERTKKKSESILVRHYLSFKENNSPEYNTCDHTVSQMRSLIKTLQESWIGCVQHHVVVATVAAVLWNKMSWTVDAVA